MTTLDRPQPGALSTQVTEVGTTDAGVPVQRWTISDGELTLRVLTLGAIVESVEVPDATGTPGDVVLGLADPLDHQRDTAFLGAVVGRFGNRIAGSAFTLDGRRHCLAANEGRHCLHGGAGGFHRQVWTATELGGPEGPGVLLELLSPDGDQGFPGRLQVGVGYRLLPGRRTVRIEYTARTDAPTVVNLTQHAYFNLAGTGAESTDTHLLQVDADRYLPVDAEMIPTGEIAELPPALDLRRPRLVGEVVRRDHPALQAGGGLDLCYVLSAPQQPDPLRRAAVLEHPGSGRRLEVFTTEPGVQVYSANKLDGSVVGRGGRTLRQSDGVCLETQHFPDAPNRPDFPSTRLDPGEEYASVTEWRFGTA